MPASGNSARILLNRAEETPFFWELAQHTLQITNSAGKTYRFHFHEWWNPSIFYIFSILYYGSSIANFPANENKIYNGVSVGKQACTYLLAELCSPGIIFGPILVKLLF